jgi:hypothetical protein
MRKRILIQEGSSTSPPEWWDVTWRPQPLPPVPEGTAVAMQATFPKGRGQRDGKAPRGWAARYLRNGTTSDGIRRQELRPLLYDHQAFGRVRGCTKRTFPFDVGILKRHPIRRRPMDYLDLDEGR